MPPISAVLITYNEESDLPRALASLAGVADEIVVVDSGSTDRTCEIAREAGARVLHRPFDQYDEQKNFAASQAAHDWVLALDADEALSPELHASLVAWKQREPDRDCLSNGHSIELSGRMDPALGLVSRVPHPLLSPRSRPVGWRAARIRARRRTGGQTRRRPAALHHELGRRALRENGGVHEPGRRGPLRARAAALARRACGSPRPGRSCSDSCCNSAFSTATAARSSPGPRRVTSG